MRNGAGLLVKLIRDDAARQRLVTPEQAHAMKGGFRRREGTVLRQQVEAEERALVFEYEEYLETEAKHMYNALPGDRRAAVVHKRMSALGQQRVAQGMTETKQSAEADAQLIGELSKEHNGSFDKWRMRRMARQAMLPLFAPDAAETDGNPELAKAAL